MTRDAKCSCGGTFQQSKMGASWIPRRCFGAACRPGDEVEEVREGVRVEGRSAGGPPLMNKTEARMAAMLALDPSVDQSHFEEVKFRVGVEYAWYTPDFYIRWKNGEIEFREVKGGHYEDDARAKFQAAAKLYPWARWTWWEYKKGVWSVRYDYPATSHRRELACATA